MSIWQMGERIERVDVQSHEGEDPWVNLAGDEGTHLSLPLWELFRAADLARDALAGVAADRPGGVCVTITPGVEV